MKIASADSVEAVAFAQRSPAATLFACFQLTMLVNSAMRIFTTLCVIFLLCGIGREVHAVDAADRKPNIILIMADDVGYEAFGCYGSKQYQTPRIDRMAKQGVRFDHCYSQPLCTPSRVKLMTGLSNARNYSAFSVLNRVQKTIGHYMRDAGYRTAIAGKWQLYGAEHYNERFRAKGALPAKMGFDNHCLWQVDKLGSRFDGPLMHIDGQNKQFDAKQFGPTVAADYLLDFMGKKSDKPFFIYYPMILVHSPFVPTPDSKNRKSKDKQKNFEDMVTYMDKLVGRFVDKAEQLGIADDTLIIFTGDNGTHKSLSSKLNGVKIKGGKGMMTDAGTRVPLVAYWPGKIKGGRVLDDLVDFSDFLPTALDVAGAKIPSGLDGQTFLPQLRGERGQPREWIYIYYCPRPERMKPTYFIRDQRFKLYGDGRFYEVPSDVLEKKPLIGELKNDAKAAHAKLAAALKTLPTKGQTLLQFAQ